MLPIGRQILFGLTLIICLSQYCDSAQQTNVSRIADLDYSVLRVNNRSNPEKPSYYCLLDFVVRNTSKKLSFETLPVRPLSKSIDFCDDSSSTFFDKGYFIYQLSRRCIPERQIDNFGNVYPNANGFLIATSCDLNLRSLNLTESFLEEKSFVVSVINVNKVDKLIQFSDAQRVKVDDSIASRNSFICMIAIFSMAVFCVIVGAYWGSRTRAKTFEQYVHKLQTNHSHDTQDLEANDSSDKALSEKDKTSELNTGSILCAVTFTICVILALYFFYKYIVYFFIAIFMLFSAISFFECTSSLMSYILPPPILAHHYKTTVKYLGLIKIKFSNIPLLIISITLPIIWFIIRHSSSNAWILQDLLCVCFCIFQLKILRLPSFKICFMLLFALFIYDIFFVFITPYFTTSGISIMEYVATGGASRRGTLFDSRCTGEKVEILPLSIRVPRNFWDSNPANPHDYCIPGSYSLLGLGDIIIPGVLVSYCGAFDLVLNNRRMPYFWTSAIFYIFGLGFSYIALVTMQIAQPALLYLVPSTCFSVIILSLFRGELHSLWRGPEKTFLLMHPNLNEATGGLPKNQEE